MDSVEILPQLVIGKVPLTPEDIEYLKKNHNITAILTLQTDEDFRMLGLSYTALWNMCMKSGILPERHPIKDLSPSDLLKKIPEVIEKLHNLINSKYKVYLHCSQGIVRSPTLASAYLIKYEGMSFDYAIEFIKNKKDVLIMEDTLKRWYLKFFKDFEK